AHPHQRRSRFRPVPHRSARQHEPRRRARGDRAGRARPAERVSRSGAADPYRPRRPCGRAGQPADRGRRVPQAGGRQPMNQAIPYWHVDAFAARPFAGNQAAVMLLDAWLPDAVLQAIGAENNFAETAFLVRDASGAAHWEPRWFTPTCEIRLCGHATLASGHVLLGRDGGERVTFRTRQAGVLEVRRLAKGGYELALPAIPTQPGEWAAAAALLGAPAGI